MDICGYTDTEKTIARSLAASGSSPGLLSRLGDERALGFADGGVRSRRLRGLCLDCRLGDEIYANDEVLGFGTREVTLRRWGRSEPASARSLS